MGGGERGEIREEEEAREEWSKKDMKESGYKRRKEEEEARSKQGEEREKGREGMERGGVNISLEGRKKWKRRREQDIEEKDSGGEKKVQE